MKILARTLAILAAALVVVGATVAFSHSSYALSTNSPFRPRDDFAQGPLNGPLGSAPVAPDGNRAARGGADRPRGSSLSFFGAGEVFKNLLFIGIIVAITVPLAGLTRRRRASGSNAERSM